MKTDAFKTANDAYFEESLKGTVLMIYIRWLIIGLLGTLLTVQAFSGYLSESIHSFYLIGFYIISNILFWYAVRRNYDPLWIRYLSGSIDIGIVIFHLYFLTVNFDGYAITSAATLLLIPLMVLLYTFKLDQKLVLYLVLYSTTLYSIVYFGVRAQDVEFYQKSLSLSPTSHFFKSAYLIFIGLVCMYLLKSYKQIIEKKVEEVSKRSELDMIIQLEKQKNTFANQMIEKERALNKELESQIKEKNELAANLEYRKEQMKSIISNLIGAAYRCKPDEKWTMVFLSDKIEEITGYSSSDFIENDKLSYKAVIHPDDIDPVVEYIDNKSLKREAFEIEYRIINKEGKIKWVHESGRGIFNDKSELIFIDGIITDIEEKKQAEKSLKETQEIINSLISNLNGAASRCLYDDFFTVKYYSEKIYDITGYYPDDFIDNKNISFADIMLEDDMEKVRAQIEEAIRNKSNYFIEFRIKHKNGEIRWINENGKPIIDSKGDVLYLDGITYDVTYNKEVEKALKTTEQKYQKIIETSPVPMSYATLDDKIEYVNRAFEETFGYNIEEIPDLDAYLEKLYPDKEYRDSIYPHWRKSIEMAETRGVPVKPFDVQMTCKNGELRNIVIHTAVLNDGIFVVFNDVTEIKNTNTALKESEKKYRELMDFLPQTIYELDLEGNVIYVNKVGDELFGRGKADPEGKISALQFFVPEDRERMVENIRKRHTGTVSEDYYEYTAIKKDGTKFPVLIYGAPMYNNGELIGSRGIILDITKLKETEESLSRAKKQLEDLNSRLEKEVQDRTNELTEANTKLIQLQKENLQSQFEVLKQQVNPHFLFNSLNVLTSLIKVEPDLAETFTEKLSKVYRYVLENKEKDLVTLNTELDFMKAYVFLIDIRFMGKVFVNLNIDENKYKNDWMILPMALQLLIENAIKHNTFSKKNPLIIDLSIDENNYLVVKNNTQTRETQIQSTGVGLANITNRYILISDKKPEFDKSDSEFVARIPLIEMV